MEKLENEIGITQLEADLMKKCKELEEENKDLKEWKENLIWADKKKSDHIDELEEENKKLKEENEMLRCSKGGTPEKVGHEEMIQYLIEENKKLKKENEELQEYKSMYEGLIVN